jgi:hypothetical protein
LNTTENIRYPDDESNVFGGRNVACELLWSSIICNPCDVPEGLNEKSRPPDVTSLPPMLFAVTVVDSRVEANENPPARSGTVDECRAIRTVVV